MRPADRSDIMALDESSRVSSSPGRQIARSTVWLTAGSILAVFNIDKAVDEKGTLVEPSGAYVSAILRWVMCFSSRLEPTA